jgi:hypothetical protein
MTRRVERSAFVTTPPPLAPEGLPVPLRRWYARLREWYSGVVSELAELRRAVTFHIEIARFRLETPDAAEDATLWRTPVDITILAVDAVVQGTSPSVTFSLRHATDRSATGTVILSDTVTNTTVGETNEVSVKVPAGDFIWLETSAASGTITDFGLTIRYTED